MTEIKLLQTFALNCKATAIGRGSVQSRPISALEKFAFINYKSGAVIREITGVAAKFKIMKDVEGRFTSLVSALLFIRTCCVQNV